MTQLYELAKVIRSKNAGPFEITLDILFAGECDYLRAKESGHFVKEKLAKLYGISENGISHIVFFDGAYGIKVTFDRRVSSGTVGDRDVYGAQQHAPLMKLEV